MAKIITLFIILMLPGCSLKLGELKIKDFEMTLDPVGTLQATNEYQTIETTEKSTVQK